jgi:hypothetical protein
MRLRARPAGGPDAAFDDDAIAVAVAGRESLAAQLLDERDRATVHRGKRGRVVAQRVAPVGIRPPRRRREDEPRATIARQAHERLVVAAQRGPALLGVEQRQRGEVRKVNALLVQEHRLEPGVGQDERTPLSCSAGSNGQPPPEARTQTAVSAVCGQQI